MYVDVLNAKLYFVGEPAYDVPVESTATVVEASKSISPDTPSEPKIRLSSY